MTYYVVQPFEMKKQVLVAGEPRTAQSASGAVSAARRLAEKGGAIAFSRSGDPASGEYEDAKVLGVFGEVPEDAAELAAAAA